MRHTRRDLRERLWQAARQSLIRRFRVAASAGVQWLLEGHEDLDGNLERDEVEVFSGVGFYSRPAAGHRTEAIVALVGGEPGHPVIVATRDQDGVKAIGDLAEDETAIFTSQAIVKIGADGSVEIRSLGGAAAALATKADLDALITTFNGHTHVYAPGPGTPLPTALPVAQAPPSSGTTTLKAQ